jgi:hypothetical protein
MIFVLATLHARSNEVGRMYLRAVAWPGKEFEKHPIYEHFNLRTGKRGIPRQNVSYCLTGF